MSDNNYIETPFGKRRVLTPRQEQRRKELHSAPNHMAQSAAATNMPELEDWLLDTEEDIALGIVDGVQITIERKK